MCEHSDYLIQGKAIVLLGVMLGGTIRMRSKITDLPIVKPNRKLKEPLKYLKVYITENKETDSEKPLSIKIEEDIEEAISKQGIVLRKKFKDKLPEPADVLRAFIDYILSRMQEEQNALSLKLYCIACGYFLPDCVNIPELANDVPQQLLKLVNIENSFWGFKIEVLFYLLHY